jgi:hypothetical protein
LWWHFLVYFNANKCNALHHWIEHVKISRMVLFQLWKWSLWHFYCKIIIEVPKITKMDAFSLLQSETSIFHDEQTSFMSFLGADKARTMWQSSPKSTILPSKQKSDATKTHTNTQNKERPAHSKFKFQIQIAQKAHAR